MKKSKHLRNKPFFLIGLKSDLRDIESELDNYGNKITRNGDAVTFEEAKKKAAEIKALSYIGES